MEARSVPSTLTPRHMPEAARPTRGHGASSPRSDSQATPGITFRIEPGIDAVLFGGPTGGLELRTYSAPRNRKILIINDSGLEATVRQHAIRTAALVTILSHQDSLRFNPPNGVRSFLDTITSSRPHRAARRGDPFEVRCS